MIPEIGVMVGAYIVTRMLALIFARFDAPESRILTVLQLATRVAAAATILVTVIVMIDLALRGSTGVTLPALP